jgi:hypothetical protein
MRLREIYKALEQIDSERDMLALNIEGRPNLGQVHVLKNLSRFRRTARILLDLPIDAYLKKQIEDSAVLATSQDELLVSPPDWQRMVSLPEQIRTVIRTLRTLTETLVHEPKPESIEIKLPEPKDFEDAVRTLDTIKKAIAQNVINPTINGVVVLDNWEPGSFWVYLYLGTASAAFVVGKICWAAALLSRTRSDNKLAESIAESAKIKTETMRALKEGLEQSMDLLIEREAKAIQSECFTSLGDREQTERLKLAIKDFATLIFRGAEFYPALRAPQEVKAAFPDMKQIGQIESSIKMLAPDSTESAPPSEAK